MIFTRFRLSSRKILMSRVVVKDDASLSQVSTGQELLLHMSGLRSPVISARCSASAVELKLYNLSVGNVRIMNKKLS